MQAKFTVTQVFNALKKSYEQIRDFKGQLVERILRRTLLGMQEAVRRQKEIKKLLTKHFRTKTRRLANEIVAGWATYIKRQKHVKYHSLVMAIKRGGRMKKLIWKVFSRNAKARKAERQETQITSLFFYQLLMKRCFKAFQSHKVTQQNQRKIIK